jgi:hypothetical protein
VSPDEPAALARLRAWTDAHRGAGLRVYRTRAGLRGLALSDLFDPTAGETEAIMTALGRCGVSAPPARFPFEAPADEQRFRDWKGRYTAACERLAT